MTSHAHFSELHIRRAVREDVPRVIELCQLGSVEPGVHHSMGIAMEAFYEAFDRILGDANQWLMVAEMEGNVVATFQMSFMTILSGGGREDCQMESVFVDPNLRGQGVGTQMMRWAIGQASERGCRRVQLTTNKKRKDAHRFYEKLGFALSHEGAKLTFPNLDGTSDSISSKQ